MQVHNNCVEGYTGPTMFVVVSFEPYDSWDVSYHRTKKGAFKYIMNAMYEQWSIHRVPGYGMDMENGFYIKEVPLYD